MFDLKRFAFEQNLPQQELAEVLGVQQPVISNMVNGSRHIRLEHIEKLRAKYGDIVDEYRTDRHPHAARPAVKPAQMTPLANTVSDTEGTYSAEQPAPVVVNPLLLVPDKVVRDPNIEILEWVSNPDNDHSQNVFNIAKIWRSTKFVIQMNNNAMMPTLYQNEFVFLKPFAEGSEIIDGEIYGIETKSRGILIRFLYDEGDSYLTRPKNAREYGEIRIPKGEDVNLYHIVFHGSTHLSSIPNTEGEMAKQLGQQSGYISSLIDQLDRSGQRVDRLIDMIDRKE